MTQEEFHKRYEYKPATDCLGEGGFGKVFKAYDTHLDKWVAIKMAEVKPGLEQVRLKHEVDLVNKLPTHPNIARYEECFTFSSFTGEYDFAVLQYYESGNLQQLLETTQLTEQQKDSILRQILAGIHFLHSQGIIHRDLKPQNILIVKRNGKYIPKITDFGISKKLDINKSSVFTNSLSGVGTLAYASPEQLTGNTIHKNTDLWSFGVIACWMFTGKLPFNSGNQSATSEAGRIELFKQITSGDISSVIQQLPSAWHSLVKQCIIVNIEERISGAGKCLEILSGKVEASINNDKTENTSTYSKTSTSTAEVPPTTTNYNSTRVESSAPRPKLTHVENDTSDNNLGRNIIIGIVTFVFLLWIVVTSNKQVAPEQASVIDSTQVVIDTVGTSMIIPQEIKFARYNNSRYNYQIEYPKNILFEQREASNNDGSFFKTKQSIEKLRVYGTSNADNETTNEASIENKYDEELFNYSQNSSTITYKKLGNSFFVISGYENGEIFYLKVIKTKDYGGYDAFAYAILKYNENEKYLYDRVSKHIFKSFISVR